MSASTYKIIYVIGLFLLAVGAVAPQPRAAMIVAEAAATRESTEARLARAMSERIAMEASGELNNYRLVELRAKEENLRRLAFEDDAAGARGELINALADQLSAAMVRRSEIAASADPELRGLAEVDAVVRELTLAINLEVRGLSV